MHAAIAEACARGAERVVLAGSDLPSLPTVHRTDAFHALDTHDVVLGPAEDGGCYVIGMRTPHQRLFLNLDWGSAAVLAQRWPRRPAPDFAWRMWPRGLTWIRARISCACYQKFRWTTARLSDWVPALPAIRCGRLPET